MDAKHWGRRVDPHFGYLRTEFGCEIVDWSDEHWCETSVTHQHATSKASLFGRLIVATPAWSRTPLPSSARLIRPFRSPQGLTNPRPDARFGNGSDQC